MPHRSRGIRATRLPIYRYYRARQSPPRGHVTSEPSIPLFGYTRLFSVPPPASRVVSVGWASQGQVGYGTDGRDRVVLYGKFGYTTRTSCGVACGLRVFFLQFIPGNYSFSSRRGCLVCFQMFVAIVAWLHRGQKTRSVLCYSALPMDESIVSAATETHCCCFGVDGLRWGNWSNIKPYRCQSSEYCLPFLGPL